MSVSECCVLSIATHFLPVPFPFPVCLPPVSCRVVSSSPPLLSLVSRVEIERRVEEWSESTRHRTHHQSAFRCRQHSLVHTHDTLTRSSVADVNRAPLLPLLCANESTRQSQSDSNNTTQATQQRKMHEKRKTELVDIE